MVLIHVIDCLHNNQPHIWHTVKIDEVTKDDAQGVRQDREGGGSVMSHCDTVTLSQETLRSVQFGKWPGKNGSG